MRLIWFHITMSKITRLKIMRSMITMSKITGLKITSSKIYHSLEFNSLLQLHLEEIFVVVSAIVEINVFECVWKKMKEMFTGPPRGRQGEGVQ